MDPCLVLTVQAGRKEGVMVWGTISRHRKQHKFNATACLSVIADHVFRFMATIYYFAK